jgi:glycosyltransferase involved in cell wall biosynthesis
MNPTQAPDTLLCLSHLRWNFVYQRPQHLLSRAAQSYNVIFVEEPIFRDDCKPCLDINPDPSGVMVVVPIVPRGHRPDGLLKAFFDELPKERLTLWYYTPLGLAHTRHLDADLVVYDCMDELSAFRFAPPDLRAAETELLGRADLVFTGGRSLYEAKRDRHPSVHAFPSSVDAAHFGEARGGQLADPADQADIPHPRLGFFGVIDERLDIGLLAEMADRRPGWSFVMIGPVVKIDPETLPRRANIHWLGGRDYKSLPAYLAHWDIGIMPFALNEATRFISPTKTPEFLAAGLPVVSSPITDVVRPYGDQRLVEIVRSAKGFIACCEDLLRRPPDEWLSKVDAFLAELSWDRTWDAMHTLMRSASRDRRKRSALQTGRFDQYRDGINNVSL